MVDAGLTEVAEHVGARLAVGLADEVGAVLVGAAQPLLALVAVHAAVVPSGRYHTYYKYMFVDLFCSLRPPE